MLIGFIPPLLAFLSVVLTIVGFLAPIGRLQFGLAALTPNATDGPRVWMGLLHSCAQSNHSASINCTSMSLLPKYDLSVISGHGGIFQVLFPPKAAAPAIMCLSLVLSFLFFVSTTLRVVGRRPVRDESNFVSRNRLVKYVTMFLGAGSVFFGSLGFMYLQVVFDLANRAFNNGVDGDSRVNATTGASFILVPIGYTLLSIAVSVLFMEYRSVDKALEKKNGAGQPKDDV